MTLDQFFNYSGWIIGVLGFIFGIWQYFNAQSRPVIKDVRVSMRAMGSVASGQRTTDITSISVSLENKGAQPVKCTGLVQFPRVSAIPLHIQSRGLVQQSDAPFLLDGKDEMDLVGAWDIQPSGTIGMGSIPYKDFVREYLPATVVITIGRREIRKILSEQDVMAAYHEFEKQSFRLGA